MKQISLIDRVKKPLQKIATNEDGCDNCPLRKNNARVNSEINKNASILVVGEAPGKEEVVQGRPFVGKSGQFLRRILDKMDIEYSVSNIVKCRPTDSKGENRAPTPKEIRCCMGKVIEEVNQYSIIVLAGGVALSIFFPEVVIADVVGSILIRDGKRFLIIYHPAYILRNIQLEDGWILDIGRVQDIVYGTENRPVGEVVDIKTVDIAMENLSKKNLLYLDVETTSLDKFNFRMLKIGIASDDNRYVFSFDKDLVEKLNNLFREKTIVIHNALFDVGMLKQVGINVNNSIVIDTMFMAYLADGKGSYGYGLKELARKKLGYKYWNRVINMLDVTDEDINLYNIEDLYCLQMIYNYFWNSILIDKMKNLCIAIISEALKAVSEMSINGMFIDIDNVVKLREEFEDKSLVILEELKLEADIDWGSSLQVGNWLLSKNIGGLKKTKGGRISVDKDAVEKVLAYAETDNKLFSILKIFKEYKSIETLRNTFLDGTFASVGVGGRVRCGFNFIGTVTGRLSSSKPNLQNIPRDGRIRQLFIAEKGYKFVEADLSQIELRVCAVIARDRKMIEAYSNGEDLHKLTAAFVNGKDIQDVNKSDRQAAKAVNFGLIYGASWKNLQRQAKGSYGVELTDSQAQMYHKRFFELYKDIKPWHQLVEKFVKENSYYESVFGRRRRFEEELASGDQGRVEAVVREAINFPVQSVASDINLMIIGELFKLRNKFGNEVDVKFVTTVHDQMMLEVKEELVEEVLEWIDTAVSIVKSNMTWFDIPLILDKKVRNKWGE